MKSLKNLVIFFSLGLLLPALSLAAEPTYDLGVTTQDVFFSAETLYVGQPVKVYASISNHGTKDVSARVNFYQGTQLIGQTQSISVRAGGLNDEVYVDWLVPTGPFNIRVEIVEQSPEDEVAVNDATITALITPVPDEDDDGIDDNIDNCPNSYNPNQEDNDRDGQGDICDNDDDNDGVTDLDELEEGTNPNDADSDSDGVSDLKDAFPNDPDKVSAPPASPAPPTPPTPTVSIPAPTDDEFNLDDKDEESSAFGGIDDFYSVLPPPGSNGSIFAVTPFKSASLTIESVQEDWNTFVFSSGIEGQNLTFQWDFGDGTVSNQATARHDYAPGRYTVELLARDADGRVKQKTMAVDVSFFNMGNWQIWLIILILLILILLAYWSMRIISRQPARSARAKAAMIPKAKAKTKPEVEHIGPVTLLEVASKKPTTKKKKSQKAAKKKVVTKKIVKKSSNKAKPTASPEE